MPPFDAVPGRGPGFHRSSSIIIKLNLEIAIFQPPLPTSKPPRSSVSPRPPSGTTDHFHPSPCSGTLPRLTPPALSP